MIRCLLALLVLVLIPLAVQAQDGKAGPEPPKVLLDTERVRVTEVRVKPGAKLELKSSPYQFLYMLSDGSLVFSPPGKMPYEFLLKAGEVSLLPSQSTAENDGEKELRAVLVEIKEGTRVATKASADKSKTRSARGRTKSKAKPSSVPRRSG
jgi:hypothetical protein